MAEGMMGRGPARRGRLSDEQRAQIRQVRMDQGRGAARAMRRDMRQEASLPVGQRPMRNRSINELQNRMSEMGQAPQSPMVMGQPTGDMMAFRPMPTERPSMAPMSPGFGPGAAQGVGAALGNLQHQPLMFNQMSPEARARQEAAMQAMRDRYTQGTGQPMPGIAQGIGAAFRDPGFQITPEQEQAMRDRYTQMQGQPMPSLQMPMQQEPGYYGSIRNMMQTGRMDANHPMAQTVGAYDRQKAMQMFGQKQAQMQMNPGFNPSLAGARFY
jgi:hypothetical protein